MKYKDMTYAEFVKKLRVYENDCPACENDTQDFCDNYCEYNSKRGDCLLGMIGHAADAIERLQSDLAKKDSQLTEWKNAWRIANSLYKSAQAEIDEHRAYQHGLVERIEQLKAELSVMKQKEQTKQEGDTNQ